MIEELKKDLKIMKKESNKTLFLTILLSFSLLFTVVLVIALSIYSIIPITFFIISLVLLVRNDRKNEKIIKNTISKPIIINTKYNFTHEFVKNKISSFNIKESFEMSEDLSFYKFKDKFSIRAIIYYSNEFDKGKFNNKKRLINKKANKKFKISEWSTASNSYKKMRINFICVDKINNHLLEYMSINAEQNLRRVEGIINVAFCNNKIIIPPIYGTSWFEEINRYIYIVGFIERTFLDL